MLPVVAAEKKQEGGVLEVAEKHDKPEITWEGLGQNVRHLSIDFAPKVGLTTPIIVALHSF